MKKIISSLLFLCTVFVAWAQQPMIAEAEEAYGQKDYQKAIQIYQDLLSVYGESAEVYYNLGNCYYQLNEVAPAILNYERALLYDPGDSDIRFNLELAKQRAVDNIVPVGDFFLASWIKKLENIASADTWAKTGVVCFILFIGCLTLFFFSRWIRLKKIGFYVGLILLFIIIFANVFAYHQKNEMINRQSAIVFTPTVTVKSSPDISGNDLFLLHEGTKVLIKSRVGEWFEIELENGNVGWMQRKDMEII